MVLSDVWIKKEILYCMCRYRKSRWGRFEVLRGEDVRAMWVDYRIFRSIPSSDENFQ